MKILKSIYNYCIRNSKFFLPYVFFICFVSCATYTKGEYNIYGVVNGLDDGEVYLMEVTDDDVIELEKAHLENGEFYFSGATYKAKPTHILINDKYEFLFFLEEGETKIIADISYPIQEKYFDDEFITLQPSFEGSPTNTLYNNYTIKRDSIQFDSKNNNSYETVMIAYAKALENDNQSKISQLEKELEIIELEMIKKLNDLRKEFVFQHSKSIVAPYIMIHEESGFGENAYTKEELKTIFNAFDSSLSYSNDYKECKSKLNAINNLSPGNIAPEFTLKTPDNSSIQLKDFRGNYVLLDFWTYWCAPCIEKFPLLKNLREKYHPKGFEIIGISDDPEIKPWKKAIAEHHLPWPQAIIKKGSSKNSVSTNYNIETVPTTYLIDSEGKIIGKDLTEKQITGILDQLEDK